MKKIASFTVNHDTLFPGVYVSRVDHIGAEAITSFDLRFTRPNFEPALENAPIHTIEHLAATFLRNHEIWSDKVIYFGPMGCRTGFYLLLAGELNPVDIIPLLKELCHFVLDYEEDIPGATRRDCGNFQDMNLYTAKHHMNNYLVKVLTDIAKERMIYSKQENMSFRLTSLNGLKGT